MDSFSSIIDDLYAGTLDRAAWDRAIITISDIVRAQGAVLLAFNPATGQVLRDEIYRLPPTLAMEYARCWATQDPRVEYSRSAPVGCPLTELTLAIPKWKTTPILNEFLIPNDLPYIMPVWLHKSQTKAVALSLQGTRRRGPFEDQDLEAFRHILPHVIRALEIRDRLEAANVRADTLTSCIDRADFGVITMTADRKILDANAAAEQILRCGRVIRIAPDRTLHLPEPGGSQLSHWLANRPRGEGLTERLIRIERGLGRLPISVLMNPVPPRPLRWVSADPVCILFLFDPERELRAKPALVAEELGISVREAELAALLAGGLELAQVAQRLNISIHTARTHLKAIYGKTGMASQAELVRRIAMGLAARSAAASTNPT
jgi:DNA-binding CsgD family transcriptional regulator